MGAIEMARALFRQHPRRPPRRRPRREASSSTTSGGGCVPDVPLLIIESPYRAFAAPMIAFIEQPARPARSPPPDHGHPPGLQVPPLVGARSSTTRRSAACEPFLAEDANVRIVEFVYDIPRGSHAEARWPPSRRFGQQLVHSGVASSPRVTCFRNAPREPARSWKQRLQLRAQRVDRARRVGVVSRGTRSRPGSACGCSTPAPRTRRASGPSASPPRRSCPSASSASTCIRSARIAVVKSKGSAVGVGTGVASPGTGRR